MRSAKLITLTGKSVVDSPVGRVFQVLIEPTEQIKWNSLYLTATFAPPGEIFSGTVMTGRFKGSGKATVTFENVQPGTEFTHYSVMSLPLGLRLGEFRHTYTTRAVTAGTEITQTVQFQPRGPGRLFAGLIARSFRTRLPISFTEVAAYLRKTR